MNIFLMITVESAYAIKQNSKNLKLTKKNINKKRKDYNFQTTHKRKEIL